MKPPKFLKNIKIYTVAEKTKIAVISIVSLAFSWLLLLVFERALWQLGAYFSGFSGVIGWHGVSFYGSAETWNRKQVLALYLMPLFVLVILFLSLSFRKKLLFNKSNFYYLFISWFYTLLLVRVFFMPVVEIIHKSGVYYALLWMGFSRIEQWMAAAIAVVFYVVNLFRVSELFSQGLFITSKEPVKPGEILLQLVYIWGFPVIFFLPVSLAGFESRYFLLGIIVTILINLPVISNYKVIVK